MRKSAAISMAIILMALVGMMVAADMALKPMKHVIGVGQDLTAVLEARSDIRPGSKVVTVARKPAERHLAKEGWGMIIELEPSKAITSRKGSMARLAYRAANEARRFYGRGRGRPLEWVEVKMTLAEGVERRALLTIQEDGLLGTPQPALPATYP